MRYGKISGLWGRSSYPWFTGELRLSGLTGDGKYAQAAESGMNRLSGFVGKHPMAFGQWLNALDYYLGDPLEVAIVGDPASEDSRELLSAVFEGFRPNIVVAAGEESDDSAVPLLSGRPRLDGRATAYVFETSRAISRSPAQTTFGASSR